MRTTSLRQRYVVFPLHTTHLTMTLGNSGGLLGAIILNEEYLQGFITDMDMILVRVKIYSPSFTFASIEFNIPNSMPTFSTCSVIWPFRRE